MMIDPFAWHRSALTRRAVIVGDEPQCGWFARRLVKGGILVPARIWIEGAIFDDAGDLVDQPELRCEVNGRAADPFEQWHWLAGSPISEAEFNFMTKRAQWAAWYAPDLPEANPKRPVDWLRARPTI